MWYCSGKKSVIFYLFFFFFNDTATTEIYTLSLHDAFRSPGTFDVDLTLRVENTGNTVLNDVQITEDLEAAYITGSQTVPAGDFNPANSFTVVGTPTIDASGVTGTAPTINLGYTGATAAAPGPPPTTSELFATGNSFNPGDVAIVTVTVQLELGTLGGATPALDGILVAENQASATDRKSTRLNSSHSQQTRMPSSA